MAAREAQAAGGDRKGTGCQGGAFQERRVPRMRRRHRARLCHPTKGWHQRGGARVSASPGGQGFWVPGLLLINGVGRWRGLRAQGWSLCSLRGAVGRARGAGDTRGVRCRRVLGTGCALPLPRRLRGGSHSIPRGLRAGGGSCRASSTRAGRVPSPPGAQLHRLAPQPAPLPFPPSSGTLFMAAAALRGRQLLAVLGTQGQGSNPFLGTPGCHGTSFHGATLSLPSTVLALTPFTPGATPGCPQERVRGQEPWGCAGFIGDPQAPNLCRGNAAERFP